MIRPLLITVAAGALVSIACFSAVHALGGLHIRHNRHFHTVDDGGPLVTRDLPWTGGETVRIAYPAQITYTQGPQIRFTVTGPSAMVDSLVLRDGQLSSPDTPWGWMGDHRSLTIAISSPNTHDFRLSGPDQLTLNQFNQDSLALHISGVASVTGTGRAKHADLHMSGAGDMDLSKLPVDDAVVSISGAGSATVDPKVSADVAISGAAHVALKTRPPTLHTHISGIGSIDQP